MNSQTVFRKTKIVATLGPACDDDSVLRRMILAGINVARINASHGDHDAHLARARQVRRISEELKMPVALMLDTKGVEVRTGPLETESVELTPGDHFSLYTDDRVGNRAGVSINYENLPQEISSGDRILLDDGNLELRVVGVPSTDEVRTEVVCGGRLTARKGVNLPEVSLRFGDKGNIGGDEADIRFAAEHDFDYIAASFVRYAADIEAIKALLHALGRDIPVIAKIENRTGIENLDEIIRVADGTMVARGDLGVEAPLENVPMIQKRIIRATVMNGKPVITATQMLDSMERNPRPTRAEVSDVANAIFDGTSAVMLSGETAIGRFPCEAVHTMARIANESESGLSEYGYLQNILPHRSNRVTEAVSQASVTMAEHLEAAAILTLTESGFTSRSISKYRPRSPIIAVTRTPYLLRTLAMNWGVSAMLYEGNEDASDQEVFRYAIDVACGRGILRPGDRVVATAGIKQTTGSTNRIQVLTV